MTAQPQRQRVDAEAPSRTPPAVDAEAPSRTRPAADDRYERWEQRLSGPVLVAALASVPAVFLTLLDGVWQTVGNVVNWVSGAVLVAETVVLAVLARDLRAWLRQHVWLLLLTAAVIPAVVLAVGPVQLLRLLRVVGALRFVRAGRILRAAQRLRRGAGLTGRASRAVSVAAGLLVAAFVGVVLADPSSTSRQLLDGAIARTGGTPLFVGLVLLAGALLAGSTYVAARRDVRRDGAGGDEDDGDARGG